MMRALAPLGSLNLLLLLGALSLACGAPAPLPSPEAGSPAPPFRLAALEGGEVALADYADQVLLLDFWATWCKPCDTQASILAEVYPGYKGRGVSFLAVNSGEEEAKVRAFVKDKPFPYPVVLDEMDSLGVELEIVALPTLVIVNPEGEISYMASGIVDAATLRRELDRASAASRG